MAQSPKVEVQTFSQRIKNLVSRNKSKSRKKDEFSLEKTIKSDGKYARISDLDKSQDRSITKTMMSDLNNQTPWNKEPVSVMERSIKFELKAHNLANDGTDEDELDAQMMSAVSEFDSKKSWGVFRPDSTGHMAWTLLGFIIIFYQSVLVPYRICFDSEAIGFWAMLEFAMDIYFWTDIFVNFNSGIYSKGILVLQRHKIMINYATGWFILDVLASFPYSFILESIFIQDSESSGLNSLSQTPQLLRLLKVIRFLRILRLIRVLKIKRLVYKIEEYIVTDTLTLIMDSLKMLMVIFFMTHLMACTFYFVGDYEASVQPLTWIVINDIQDLTLYEKYITCVYFSFTTITTVGYGDISPNTNLEKIYGMLAMLIACGFFAYIVGSIGSIVNKSNIMVSEFRLRMSHINQFLIHKNIPMELKTSIMSYLEYMCDYKKMYKLEEGEVLAMLNDTLRENVIVYLNGRIIQSAIVFKHFSMLFLSEITFKLGHHTFTIDDHIFEEGNIGDKLFFINKGSALLVHKKSKTFIKELGVETCFGEVSFFSDLPRAATSTAKTFTETMFIDRESFHEVSKIYAKNQEIFEEIYALIRDKGDLSPIGVKCYVCNELGHMAMECREFWRIEGNVKRHLRRLRSINNHKINKSISDVQQSSFKRKNMEIEIRGDSKALRKQQIEDDEIREMIKHNLEHGGTEDIIDVIRRNQEVVDDDDEIGLHDHIYDSSIDTERRNKKKKSKKKRKKSKADLKTPKSELKKDKEEDKSDMLEADLESEEFKKKTESNFLRRDFPKIDVTKMSTMKQDSFGNSKASENSKQSKASGLSKLSKVLDNFSQIVSLSYIIFRIYRVSRIITEIFVDTKRFCNSPGGSFNERIEDPDIKIISKPKILKKRTDEGDQKLNKRKPKDDKDFFNYDDSHKESPNESNQFSSNYEKKNPLINNSHKANIAKSSEIMSERSSHRKSNKGDFELYAERRLELLGNFKNRRQTERNFKKYDITSKQNQASSVLRSNSSMYREPVSHTHGAFKTALKRRRLESTEVPLFNPKNFDLNYDKRRFDGNNPDEDFFDDDQYAMNEEPEGFNKLLKRNQHILRKNSIFSQASGLRRKSRRLHSVNQKVNLPGGAGNIPNDINFAIFELSEEDEDDKAEIMRADADAYDIYAIENKKLLF
ncbi:unnamed protein product [Moneuplotes crassus]|uniref:Cyclic nucleotide-binding domain-containing protein n=1 Tax=Euplotes crassus TaxID=5936 RepID=A0AAD1UH70_EUPCR|nr:unnamed protein product [Moneuplotes crassus]